MAKHSLLGQVKVIAFAPACIEVETEHSLNIDLPQMGALEVYGAGGETFTFKGETISHKTSSGSVFLSKEMSIFS